jgi:hypothetical protein
VSGRGVAAGLVLAVLAAAAPAAAGKGRVAGLAPGPRTVGGPAEVPLGLAATVVFEGRGTAPAPPAACVSVTAGRDPVTVSLNGGGPELVTARSGRALCSVALRSVALACAAAKKCSADWRIDFLATSLP